MSDNYVASNNASSTVAVGFNATATSITVATGEGARFPSPTSGDYTLVTCQKTDGTKEIICIVGRSADVLTVGIPGSAAANVAGRNYEAIYGMSAASFSIGDVISCRPTAGTLEDAINVASKIAAATAKTTPVDADTLPLTDSADSSALKTLTWANVKVTLKAYFDTLYGIIGTANTWTAANTFRAASAIRTEAASTQDAIVLAGRAGGTSSYAVTLTPATLTANRVHTLPDKAGTVAMTSDIVIPTITRTTFEASGSLTIPAGVTQVLVTGQGCGGGGGGSTSGSTGGTTTFGPNGGAVVLTLAGGSGGTARSGITAGAGGAGGGSGINKGKDGANGQYKIEIGGGVNPQYYSSALGGEGGQGMFANLGSGGRGSDGTGLSGAAGGGGGAGEQCISFPVTVTAGQWDVTIGTGGAAGTSLGGGTASAAGQAGFFIVEYLS